MKSRKDNGSKRRVSIDSGKLCAHNANPLNCYSCTMGIWSIRILIKEPTRGSRPINSRSPEHSLIPDTTSHLWSDQVLFDHSTG